MWFTCKQLGYAFGRSFAGFSVLWPASGRSGCPVLAQGQASGRYFLPPCVPVVRAAAETVPAGSAWTYFRTNCP